MAEKEKEKRKTKSVALPADAPESPVSPRPAVLSPHRTRLALYCQDFWAYLGDSIEMTTTDSASLKGCNSWQDRHDYYEHDYYDGLLVRFDFESLVTKRTLKQSSGSSSQGSESFSRAR